MVYFCVNCNRKLRNNQRKFCGNSCKCKFFNKNNPEKSNIWNKKNKKPLVNNRCVACGSLCGRKKYCSDKCKPKYATIPLEKSYWNGMSRVNSKCFCCDYTFDLLHVHHRDGNHNNNCKTNLISLCPLCHKSIHYKSNNKRYGIKEIGKLVAINLLREELNNHSTCLSTVIT